MDNTDKDARFTNCPQKYNAPKLYFLYPDRFSQEMGFLLPRRQMDSLDTGDSRQKRLIY